MDTITITIPSTGRRRRLSACLRSIDYLDCSVFIGAVIKDDLPTAFSNTKVTFSKDCPVKIQNDLARSAPHCSHILPIADDVVFEPGAIQKAVDALNSTFPDGDGVVSFDIKNMTGKDKSPYAFMLIGNRFFNERLSRVLFFPEYKHFYADTELGEYAESLGLFKHCPEAQLTHFHPSAGAPADETHTRNRQDKWRDDFLLYTERKNTWLKSGYASFAVSQPTIHSAA